MVNSSQTVLDATFAALADPTRRGILARLALGTSSIGELAQPFDISAPAISKHIRVLEDAGLLIRQKEGRIHRCALDARPIERAADWIDEMRRFWESQFEALEAYLESMKEESCPPPPPPRPRKHRRSASTAPSPRRETKFSKPGPTRKR